MADLLRKSAAWLGLVAEDRYAYDDSDDPTEYVEVVEEPSAEVVHMPASHTVARQEPKVADLSRIVTIHPRTYNEAKTIGEHFREGTPVIMNLSEMEDIEAKRLVDFAAGLIFGLHGTIQRVTSKVFLLSPEDVNVTAEDRERIAEGFFNQS